MLCTLSSSQLEPSFTAACVNERNEHLESHLLLLSQFGVAISHWLLHKQHTAQQPVFTNTDGSALLGLHQDASLLALRLVFLCDF